MRYADGAGNVSEPFVEYVRCPNVKGSERSAVLSDFLALVGCSCSWRNGPRESSRMASVTVGWKRPPYCEYWPRCVGRSCPNVKKVESALRLSV